jgi:hypothetical protein
MQPSYIPQLEDAYEQVNASFGDFSMGVIKASTKALKGDSATYNDIEGKLTTYAGQRDQLANDIRSAISDATFGSGTISQSQAQSWIDQANHLIQEVQALS